MYGSQYPASQECQATLNKSVQVRGTTDNVEDIIDDQRPDMEDVYQNGIQTRPIFSPVGNDVTSGDFGLEGDLSGIRLMTASLRRIPWKLYWALLLTRLIPTVYLTTRVFYLGEIPDASGVNIASQLTWVNLFLQVIQETLILPLYFMIGVTIDDELETKNRVKTGIIFTFLVHGVFSAVVAAAAVPLVQWMAQDKVLVEDTVTYIRLELASLPCYGVVQFATVVFTVYKWQFHIYAILVIRLVLSVILDTFFISSFTFSLKFGVNGIAYGDIISDGVICFYCITVLSVRYRSRTSRCSDTRGICSNMSFSWMRTWGSVGFYSGLDCFIRNFFYIVCVIRMMNVIKQQGTYWRANEFLSNWLLVPLLALADVLKQDTGASTSPLLKHTYKTTGYVIIMIFVALLWCASIPTWTPFIKTVLNVPSDDVIWVYQLSLILMPSYIVFMANTLMDSVFIGKGTTINLAIQSIITNACVFAVSFVLYLCGIYHPTLINVASLFSTSIAVDCTITAYLYYRYLYKVNYKI